MCIPGFGFCNCFNSKSGSNRNSNHNTVSGEMGTVPGLNKSTSILDFNLWCIKLTFKIFYALNNHKFTIIAQDTT